MSRLVITVAVVLLSGVLLSAHPSYTAFDRNRTVTLTGTVEHVRYANPHVVLTLRVPGEPPLTVTWGSLSQLAYAGVTAKMLRVGEQLTISGSRALDPARHELTLISRVEDPAHGWRWEGNRVVINGGSESD